MPSLLIRLIIATLLLSTAEAQAESLTLGECLARAKNSNTSLKVAAYDQKIAAEGELVGKSGYLPRIDVQGGYTAQLDAQGISLNGRTVETQQADYAFASLGIYQTLYDFGRTSARADRARTVREVSTFNYAGHEQDVFLQVVTAYFGILHAQRLLQAAEDEVVQMDDHLRIAQNLFQEGIVTRNDLLQAEVRLAGSRQRRLDSANRLENAWLQLNFLTEQSPDFRGTLEEATTVTPPMMSDPDDRSIANRAEIKAMQKTIEGSDLEVKENRGGYYPELFTKLGLDYVQNRQVREQTIMAATVGLKVNLFDGEATTGRYRQAVASRSKNEEALRQLRAAIRLEYRTAANDAKVSFERIKVAEKSILQGEENLRINKDRYQAQMGTATDVIDAQTLLTQTRTDYYRSIFDYQVALARVRKALGEL